MEPCGEARQRGLRKESGRLLDVLDLVTSCALKAGVRCLRRILVYACAAKVCLTQV